MPSRNVESRIEDFKNEYIGSLKERQEIKDAYIKCKGDIPKILKYVPLADDCKAKKRIIGIIDQMISNGEVVKFPDKSKITTQNTIDDAVPGTSGLKSLSTPSRTEQTIININTSNPSLHPLACSTPHSNSNFSANTFSNSSYIGIEDILKMDPGFMNDSRSTTITNCKETETGKENSSSKLNFLRNNTSKCHDTPSRKRQTEHERIGKKLKVHDCMKSTNGREFAESNEKTLIAIDNNDSVQIIKGIVNKTPMMNNKHEFKKLKQTTFLSNKIRSNDNATSNIKGNTSEKKIEDVDISLDNRKQNIRRDKPGPSCPQQPQYTTILSSADQAENTEERQISNNRNMTNQICGINDLKCEVTYSEDTVMHTACSLALPPPNSYRDQSTSIADCKKTTEKYLNHSNKIQVLQNVPLTPLNTGCVQVKSKREHLCGIEHQDICSKQGSSIKEQLKTKQISKSQLNSTLSNSQQTEFALDLSRKTNLQATVKKILHQHTPTSSKRIIEIPTIPNITEGIKKGLPDNNVEVTDLKGISKKLPVRNEQKKKNVDESRTSEWRIRDKRISKTAHQEKPAPNITLDTNKIKISITADAMNSKSSSSDASKSVCSKTEVINKGIPLSKCLKTKNEKMKYTERCLILIRELFSKYIKNLPDAEKKLLKLFNDEDSKGQCICLEMLINYKEWYNVFNFSGKVRPDMEDSDIFEVVTAFKEKGIIDMNYESEHEVVLLNQLNKESLIKICDDLEKEGLKIYNRHKPEEKLTTKNIIEIIQKHCNTKSKIHLLREKIRNRMGNCMKINKNFQEIFYTVYLLGTYINSRFLKMEDYFKSILVDNVTFPEYPIDTYTIFTSWVDFVSYSKAKMYEIEFKNSLQDLEEVRQICGKIFAELKLIKNKRNDPERLKDVPHLIQFTAKAVYVSTLSNASDKLLDKYPNIVREWLEYMIRYMKAEFPHEIGGWYYNLIGIYTQFLKPFDYNRAAEELIKVVNEERQHLSGIQLHRIFQMGRKFVRKDGILQKNKDDIVELEVKLLPKRITNFPVKIADGKSGMTNREYYHTLLSSTWGGEIILASFTLFFHNIIYNTRTFIPGTFVSNIQSEPLDMNTRYFYANRQDEIEQRLREIEREWSDSKVISFLKENYDKHSHEFALCKIDEVIKDVQALQNLVQGFGRRILAKIYRRLAENFTEHRRGFPDLRISGTDKKKFLRMVKRSNHKLSIEQMLWLDYLRSDETEVEIIVVPPDNYKNVKKMKKNDLPKSSSTPDKVP